MIELKIDKEFERLVPPPEAIEFDRLCENILKDGEIYEPIIVWDGTIIDGHHRYRILQEHPELKYRIEEKQFENRYKAMAWICMHQLGRRNLTPLQKVALIGEKYKAEKNAHGGQSRFSQCEASPSPKNLELEKGGENKTSYRIASEMGVSHTTVENAEKFVDGMNAAEEVAPGIRRDIMSGKIKPTQADVAAIAKTAPENRKAAVTKLQEPKVKIKRAKSPVPNALIHSLVADLRRMKPKIDESGMLASVSTTVAMSLRAIKNSIDEFPKLITDDANRSLLLSTLKPLESLIVQIREYKNTAENTTDVTAEKTNAQN